MKLFIYGIIIGIGKILPGISGGLIAIYLGVYDKLINSLMSFYKFKSIKFLLIIGCGIIISILFGSKLIYYLLDRYYLIIMLLFIGMIIGSVFNFKRKLIYVNKYLFLIGFISLFFTLVIHNDNSIINIYSSFFIGIIEAFSIIVPGISGTAILINLGYYNIIINLLSELTNINVILSNITFILPFLLGLIIGSIIFIIIMSFIIRKYKENLYSFILGVSYSSIILLFIETLKYKYRFIDIILGLFLFIIGYKVSKKFI